MEGKIRGSGEFVCLQEKGGERGVVGGSLKTKTKKKSAYR